MLSQHKSFLLLLSIVFLSVFTYGLYFLGYQQSTPTPTPQTVVAMVQETSLDISPQISSDLSSVGVIEVAKTNDVSATIVENRNLYQPEIQPDFTTNNEFFETTLSIESTSLTSDTPTTEITTAIHQTTQTQIQTILLLENEIADSIPAVSETNVDTTFSPESQDVITDTSNQVGEVITEQPSVANWSDVIEDTSTVAEIDVNLPIANRAVLHIVPQTSSSAVETYVHSFGGHIINRIDQLNVVVVELPDNLDFSTLPTADFVTVEADYYATAQFNIPPNDPLYPNQWALATLDVETAWSELADNPPEFVVAIVDSGVCNHPDLEGRIGAGYDYIENDTVPQDEFGHGCGVTGVIAANIDNDLGIAGVVPNVMIMPLRVLDANGLGSYSDIAAAIIYATDHGADYINLSLGGTFSSSVLQQAVNYAHAQNIPMIAAAGNDGTSNVRYPARYNIVTSVGATNIDGDIAYFSNYGDDVDIYAPGEDILTTNLSGGNSIISGTSFSAPYITGMMVLEDSRSDEPDTEPPSDDDDDTEPPTDDNDDDTPEPVVFMLVRTDDYPVFVGNEVAFAFVTDEVIDYIASIDCTGDGSSDIVGTSNSEYVCVYSAAGTFTVHGQANDSNGDISDLTFEVTVLPPEDGMAMFRSSITILYSEGRLKSNSSNAVHAKLDVIERHLANGRIRQAVNQLGLLANQLERFANTGTVDTNTLEDLLRLITRVQESYSFEIASASLSLSDDEPTIEILRADGDSQIVIPLNQLFTDELIDTVFIAVDPIYGGSASIEDQVVIYTAQEGFIGIDIFHLQSGDTIVVVEVDMSAD